MEISELGTWTIGWNRDKAHLFVDGETDMALCGNKILRVDDRRLLVDPSLMTYVYLNNEAFCFPCVKVIRRRLEVRVDDFGLHYGDIYGWSDDPKDIVFISGPVDLRRGRTHHYHPVFDPQPDFVQTSQTPMRGLYVWTFYAREPILYLAVEIVPSDMESDIRWRETLKVSRAAGLGDSFSGHPPSLISHSDLGTLMNAMTHQMHVTRRLSSNLPTPQTKARTNRSSGN